MSPRDDDSPEVPKTQEDVSPEATNDASSEHTNDTDSEKVRLVPFPARSPPLLKITIRLRPHSDTLQLTRIAP